MIRQVHPSDLPHKALGGACREASASPDSRLAPDGGLEIGISSRHGNETQQVDRERDGLLHEVAVSDYPFLNRLLTRIIRGARCQCAFRLNSRTLANRTVSLPKRGDLGKLVTAFNHRTSCEESSRPHE